MLDTATSSSQLNLFRKLNTKGKVENTVLKSAKEYFFSAFENING